jgi:hypothetical protein
VIILQGPGRLDRALYALTLLFWIRKKREKVSAPWTLLSLRIERHQFSSGMNLKIAIPRSLEYNCAFAPSELQDPVHATAAWRKAIALSNNND